MMECICPYCGHDDHDWSWATKCEKCGNWFAVMVGEHYSKRIIKTGFFSNEILQKLKESEGEG